MAAAVRARASPRFRHGRRTLIFSSQPRWTPRRRFSSDQIQVLDHARHLVAVPGHDPQVGVGVRLVERLAESLLAVIVGPQWSWNASCRRRRWLGAAPAARGASRGRRGAGAAPPRRGGRAHQEEVTDRLQARALVERPGARLLLLGVRAEPDRPSGSSTAARWRARSSSSPAATIRRPDGGGRARPRPTSRRSGCRARTSRGTPVIAISRSSSSTRTTSRVTSTTSGVRSSRTVSTVGSQGMPSWACASRISSASRT